MNIIKLKEIIQSYGFFEEILTIVPLLEKKESGQMRLIYLISLKNGHKIICRISCETNFSSMVIEQQCCFSEKLRKYGIPVAKKYEVDGKYCITCFYDSCMCCVTLEEYVGTDLENIDLKTFEYIGILLGKMHYVSEHSPSKIDYSTISNALKTNKARFSKLLVNIEPFICSLDCVRELQEKHDDLVFALRNSLGILPHGAVHGDLSIFNNLCIENDKISIIDFNLAGDEIFLCDMLACVYSSIYKYSWKDKLSMIDKEEAFLQFVLGYRKQRKLSISEKNVFNIAAALFDGLYYCKSIIEEYRIKKDVSVLEKFKFAQIHFDPLKHKM